MGKYEIITIKEIANTQSGGTPSRKIKDYYIGDIPWVKSGELQENIITETEEKITQTAIDKSSAKLLPINTLLVAMYGANVGRVAILGIEAATNQAICAIQPKDNRLSTEYLYYYFIYYKNQLLDKAFGGAQKNISQQVIKNLEIPVPAIEEQKQIVSKIKECFTLLDKSEEKLKQAEVRLQKILDSEMKKLIEVNKEHSNWTANTVKELSNKIQYGFTAKASNKGNAKMLRITDIQKGNVDWNNVPLIQITPDELSKYKLEKGDILFARSGATAGKSYIYQSDNNEQDVFASYLIRVQTNPNQILAEYLYQYFQTRSYWDQITDKVDGTAQPNVNGTKLGEIQIHYPKDLSEQSTIANKLKSLKTDLEKVHSDLVATRNRSETLRQSILKKAFEGKLI